MADTMLFWNVKTAFVIFLGFSVIATVSATVLVDMCPSACQCLLGSFVDCRSKGLLDVPKDLPNWATRLDLDGNALKHIHPKHFANLTKLQSLSLSNNEITFINTSVFQHLPSLKTLKLNHNKFQELPVLSPNSTLTELFMQHNMIHTLDTKALYHTPHLTTLDLRYNHITDITNKIGTFPVNNSLKTLLLNSNRLVIIESGALNNLTSLETLKLNKNNLGLIPKDTFVRLKRLKYLEMNKNKLKVIVGLTFKGLENLIVLKIRRNVITSLGDGAFYGLTHIQKLYLDHNNITSVLKWLYGLDTLQELYLAHNKIHTIGAWQYCKKLTFLDLSHNNLVTLPKEAFKDLELLQTLDLDNNKITHIADNAFSGLSNLLSLSLNNNQIFWTIEDSQGAFLGLSSLTRLAINNNYIKSIAKDAFNGLTTLQNLDISSNNITTVEHNVFTEMHGLKEFKLNSSNLLCDCHLAWLTLWMKGSGFEPSVKAVCAHPEWIKGKSAFSIDQDDFKCKDFPKPSIIHQPKSKIALKGQNVTLDCKAMSSESAMVTYQWRKNDVIIRNAQVKNSASQTTSADKASTPDIYTYHSRLYLTRVQDIDKGSYQCIISNRFGSAYSERVDIAVHVFPRFTKKPADITVKAGEITKLECLAVGSPQPVISWHKDGGISFPAARERRIQMMPKDHVFFIVGTKSVDEGVYSCMATNAAGTIIANASITVSDIPTFSRKMENKVTDVGKTSVLECLAQGHPPPKVEWLKDDKPLSVTPRHFFTANNQLLIIIHTQISDAGLYTCEVSNDLGVESDSAILTVMGKDGVASAGGASAASLDPDHHAMKIAQKQNKSVDDSTSTEIMVIAIVCCVVGTSLVWVIIIYQTRIRQSHYSLTNTDETNLHADGQGSSCNSSQKDAAYTSSQYMLTGYMFPDHHSKESGYDSSDGRKYTTLGADYSLLTGYMFPNHHSKESGYDSSDGRKYTTLGADYRHRQIALMASDASNEELQQYAPLLTGDTHKKVHYSGSDAGSVESSLSTGSTQLSGGGTLRTFRPFPSVITNHHTTSPDHPTIRKCPSDSVVDQSQERCEDNEPRRITPYQFHYSEEPPGDSQGWRTCPCTVYVNPHYDNTYVCADTSQSGWRTSPCTVYVNPHYDNAYVCADTSQSGANPENTSYISPYAAPSDCQTHVLVHNPSLSTYTSTPVVSTHNSTLVSTSISTSPTPHVSTHNLTLVSTPHVSQNPTHNSMLVDQSPTIKGPTPLLSMHTPTPPHVNQNPTHQNPTHQPTHQTTTHQTTTHQSAHPNPTSQNATLQHPTHQPTHQSTHQPTHQNLRQNPEHTSHPNENPLPKRCKPFVSNKPIYNPPVDSPKKQQTLPHIHTSIDNPCSTENLSPKNCEFNSRTVQQTVPPIHTSIDNAQNSTENLSPKNCDFNSRTRNDFPKMHNPTDMYNNNHTTDKRTNNCVAPQIKHCTNTKATPKTIQSMPKIIQSTSKMVESTDNVSHPSQMSPPHRKHGLHHTDV